MWVGVVGWGDGLGRWNDGWAGAEGLGQEMSVWCTYSTRPLSLRSGVPVTGQCPSNPAPRPAFEHRDAHARVRAGRKLKSCVRNVSQSDRVGCAGLASHLGRTPFKLGGGVPPWPVGQMDPKYHGGWQEPGVTGVIRRWWNWKESDGIVRSYMELHGGTRSCTEST
eukprot:gene24019-biopygen7362